jgi:hypothetical protein
VQVIHIKSQFFHFYPVNLIWAGIMILPDTQQRYEGETMKIKTHLKAGGSYENCSAVCPGPMADAYRRGEESCKGDTS